MSKRKATSWEDIEKETQEKIVLLREKEKQLLEKSGYTKWKKSFVTGYATYAILYYFIFIFKRTELSKAKLGFLFLPAFPYAYFLMYKYFDVNSYRDYYLNHIELNRVIKKTSKSSEYK
jgi:hypothetical protein